MKKNRIKFLIVLAEIAITGVTGFVSCFSAEKY
jgi:hypothetical protein